MLEETSDYPPWTVNNITTCDDILKHAKGTVAENTLKLIFTYHLDSHKSSNNMVYTDGSKTTDGVSFAIVGRRLGHADNIQGTKIQCDASIFRAELLAIKSAVEKGETAPENKTIIVTDSKSSVQAIQKVYSRNPIVQEIKGKAHNSPKKFQLCWVPSRVVNLGSSSRTRLERLLEFTTRARLDQSSTPSRKISTSRKCREFLEKARSDSRRSREI